MTPDEIKLWSKVYIAKSLVPKDAWYRSDSRECERFANEAVEAFRKANKRWEKP